MLRIGVIVEFDDPTCFLRILMTAIREVHLRFIFVLGFPRRSRTSTLLVFIREILLASLQIRYAGSKHSTCFSARRI